VLLVPIFLIWNGAWRPPPPPPSKHISYSHSHWPSRMAGNKAQYLRSSLCLVVCLNSLELVFAAGATSQHPLITRQYQIQWKCGQPDRQIWRSKQVASTSETSVNFTRLLGATNLKTAIFKIPNSTHSCYQTDRPVDWARFTCHISPNHSKDQDFRTLYQMELMFVNLRNSHDAKVTCRRMKGQGTAAVTVYLTQWKWNVAPDLTTSNSASCPQNAFVGFVWFRE
jgi:hypothetical protein